MSSDLAQEINREATQAEVISLLVPCAMGWTLAILLYGAYLVLHLQYVTGDLYTRARRSTQATVWAVFVLATAYTVLMWTEVCIYTVSKNRTLAHLFNGFPYESTCPALSATVAAPVQFLLMLRAAGFLRNRRLRYIFIGATSTGILFALGSAIFTTVQNALYTTNLSLALKSKVDYNGGLVMMLWGNAFVDGLISISLATTLRSRVAGFSATTDGLLKKLARSALQTVSYTTLLAVLGAITAAVFSQTSNRYGTINFAFWPPLPACYGLSLYTTLSTCATVERHIGSNTLPPQAPTSSRSKRQPTGPSSSPPVRQLELAFSPETDRLAVLPDGSIELRDSAEEMHLKREGSPDMV
ncbi:hypothetical protein JCM10207_006783 [Rhodosporidiobolus poonsookiae]